MYFIVYLPEIVLRIYICIISDNKEHNTATAHAFWKFQKQRKYIISPMDVQGSRISATVKILALMRSGTFSPPPMERVHVTA